MKNGITWLLLIVMIIIAGLAVNGQTTAFSYQGTLAEGGVPANGSYEMQFKLFDSLGGPTQIGSTVTRNPVAVTNGGFAVVLDFGSSAFPGADRFLEIAVRNLGGGSLTTLSPRSQIHSTPYTVRALTVTGPVTGANSVAMLSVSNSQPGIIDPSPTNLPPAALKGEATSAINANVGLMGIANGSNSAGVLGITNGNDATGVHGLATSPTGETIGVGAEVLSPSGTALDIHMPTGGNGHLINASSGINRGGSSTKFNVNSDGNVTAAGSITANGVNSTSGVTTVQLNAQAASVQSLGVSGPVQLNNGAGIIGNLSVNGNLNVTGTKNAVATLPDGRRVLLYATESPENWYEDLGTIRLRNGRASVRIDKTFAQAANVEMPYMVFLTPGGNCRGLYVTRKTATTFEVRELGNGRSNIVFDFRIVARRRGFEAVRFAPAPAKPKSR